MSAPFFLQVDADFILDPDCAWTLRQAMAPDVGITVGALRDPLIGAVSGVKPSRRECFASTQLKDIVGTEVEFYRTLWRDGRQPRYVLVPGARPRPHTLGDHQPSYTLDYVFGTYHLLGARYALDNDSLGLLWRMSELRRSSHRLAAVIARVAIVDGLFSGQQRNVAKPAPRAQDTPFLRELAGETELAPSRNRADLGASPAFSELCDALHELGSLPPPVLLNKFSEVGARLRATSHDAFRRALSLVGEIRHPHSWLAEVGLAHGALSRSSSSIHGPALTTLEAVASSSMSSLFPRPA